MKRLSGHRSDDQQPLRAEIGVARRERVAGADHWVCLVRCPAILNGEKLIAGVDAPQAEELAEMFVRELLAAHGCTFITVDES